MFNYIDTCGCDGNCVQICIIYVSKNECQYVRTYVLAIVLKRLDQTEPNWTMWSSSKKCIVKNKIMVKLKSKYLLSIYFFIFWYFRWTKKILFCPYRTHSSDSNLSTCRVFFGHIFSENLHITFREWFHPGSLHNNTCWMHVLMNSWQWNTEIVLK